MIPSLAKKQRLHHTDVVPVVPTLPDPAATSPSTPLKAYEPESKLSLVMTKPVFALCEQHPRSLISTFVVRCLDSIIPLVSISEISSLYLSSVAAQTGLRLP